MLALFLSSLFTLTSLEIISIQAVNETYFAYLPLSPDCDYSSSDHAFPVHPPAVNYTQLDPPNIYRLLQEGGELTFWGVLRQGITMLTASPSLLANTTYQQILLYDSPIQANFTSRQLILLSYGLLGQITFHYILPQLANSTLQAVPQGNQTFFLGAEIENIVQECQQIQIAFSGGNLFIAICVNTTQMFSWNVSNPAQNFIYKGIPFEAGDGISAITPNPQLLVPSQSLNINSSQDAKMQIKWNVVLLSEQGDELFCWANLSSISCQSYLSEELWLEQVVQRTWGAESTLEIDEIELVLAKFPHIISQPMPGQVVSVFAFGPNIQIEWVLNSATYLTIYVQQQLIINTTLNGPVVSYGRERIITQNQVGFWMVQFILPFFTISSNYYDNTNANFSLNCKQNIYQYQYQIVWSNFLYPLFLVNQINQTALFSDQAISLQVLNEYFQVVGPAFNVFINDQTDLNIDLLDIEAAQELGNFLDVVAIIESSSSLPFSIILINIWGKLINFNLRTKKTQPMKQPCSFSQLSQSYSLSQGYLFEADEYYCYCSMEWNCNSFSQQQVPMIIYKNTRSLLEYRMKLGEIFGFDGLGNDAVKLQLNGLAEQGYLVIIYQNNTVALQSTKGQILYSYISTCEQFNATWGTIFERDFEDDFLILYCSNATYVTQLLIRNNQFLPFRSIPLYGFLTRDTQSSIISGTNFVFLEVNLNPLFFGDLDSRSTTGNQSCCILRLDPCEFTVSVIAEIMLANSLVGVYSVTGADVVIYNGSEVSALGPALKVYFQTSWIGFQEEGVCTSGENCGPTVYPFSISFVSVFYNFAATYMSEITFDTSASNIRIQSPVSQEVELKPQQGSEGLLKGSALFSFGEVMGPVGTFKQHNTEKEGGNIFSISQNKIVTESKQISSGEEAVLQILDLANGVGFGLDNFIMVVGEFTLWVYQKYGSEWLQLKQQIKSPQSNCFYSPWQSLNGSLSLIGNCFNINQQSPLLTLIIIQNSTNQSIVSSLSNFTFPSQLRTVSTIVTPSSSLIIGILEGPAKSIGGVLSLCTISVCSTLNITGKLIFFIDYDQQAYNNSYIIAGLDVEKLCFWINPSPSATPSISADVVINYQIQLKESCSKIKILSWSAGTVNIILSCTDSYQQITVNLTSQTISNTQNKFMKFANCEQIDSFKPQFILAPNSQSEISILTIQCSMNVEVIRFQEITAYGGNSSQVVTGYLQIFTSLGPRKGSVWWPVRLIDLGTAQLLPTSLLYTANGQQKILYETIDGIMLDNFLDPFPVTEYTLLELTKQVIYPVVKMIIENPYYKLTIAIKMQAPKADDPFALVIASFTFFVVFNLTTLIFFICWCVNKKPLQKRRTPGLVRDNNSTISSSKDSTVSGASSSPRIIIKQPLDVDGRRNQGIMRMQELSNSSSYNDTQGRNSTGRQARPRGTEIELFQPR